MNNIIQVDNKLAEIDKRMKILILNHRIIQAEFETLRKEKQHYMKVKQQNV